MAPKKISDLETVAEEYLHVSTPEPTLPAPALDFDLLEYAFTSWLNMYESTETHRWDKLFWEERNLLAQAQWARFRDELEATMKAGAVGGGIVDSFDDIKRESLWRQRSGNGKKFL